MVTLFLRKLVNLNNKFSFLNMINNNIFVNQRVCVSMLIKLELSDFPRNPICDRQLRLSSVRTGSLADRTKVKVNQKATALHGCGYNTKLKSSRICIFINCAYRLRIKSCLVGQQIRLQTKKHTPTHTHPGHTHCTHTLHTHTEYL